MAEEKDIEKNRAGEAREERPQKKRHVKETVEAVVIALVLALFIRTFVIQAFKIPSGSMEDTLLVGDHIIVTKFSYGLQVPKPAMIKVFGVTVPFFQTTLVRAWGEVERGDIVVFRFPDDRHKDYIKRVVGLPGETVEIKNRTIYIDDLAWDDPYGVYKGALYGSDASRSGRVGRNAHFGPYTVPDGQVFVMGDNRDRSFDSRYWGTVPVNDIKGKAWLIYWSWDSQNSWLRFSRIGDTIQ